jgi:hypothetical protein
VHAWRDWDDLIPWCLCIKNMGPTILVEYPYFHETFRIVSSRHKKMFVDPSVYSLLPSFARENEAELYKLPILYALDNHPLVTTHKFHFVD